MAHVHTHTHTFHINCVCLKCKRKTLQGTQKLFSHFYEKGLVPLASHFRLDIIDHRQLCAEVKGHMTTRGHNKENGFDLKFGHPGSIQTHTNAGRSGSVAHLSQHAAPCLFVIFIPVKENRSIHKLTSSSMLDLFQGTFLELD